MIKVKKKMVTFLKIWVHFLGARTDSTLRKYVWVQHHQFTSLIFDHL